MTTGRDGEQTRSTFPWALFAIPGIAILAGQIMVSLYDDDSQSAGNAWFVPGIALTVVGIVFLVVFALIACVHAVRSPRR